MPTFQVTDPTTGVSLQLTGDSPPTEQELEQIFASQAQPEREGFPGAGVLEPAATVISGAIAEPLAGLAGIAQAINPFADPGAGAEAVEATREALTFQPRTEAGQAGLQSVGEVLAPVGEVVSGAEKALGDTTFELTGSPALAAFATSLPTAALEIIGIKGGRRLAKTRAGVTPKPREVKSLLNEAVPSAEKLREVSSGVFKELSEAKIDIKPQAYNRLVKSIERSTRGAGLDPRTTPRAAGALDALKDVNIGKPVPLTEIDTLRKVAQGVARNIDPTEKALAVRMIDEIDSFIETATGNQFTGGKIKAIEVGKKYNAARKLYGRAKKSELVQEAIETAKGRASGFENGIRIELGKLIKNKRTRNFFTKSEKEAIKSIERGNVAQNFSKFLGRFAFNEGRSNNILSALGGVAAGSAVGGTVGAIAVPAVGTAARRIAKNITKGRADFLDTVTRAGSDGKAIAKAYIEAVPKVKRSTADLSDLLSDPNIDLAPLLKKAEARVKEAAEIAAGRQIIGEAVGIAAAGAASGAIDEEQ